MNKTTKATLWILGVFMALSMAAYFAACGDDTAADTGTPPACTKAGEACTGGKCLAETGGTFKCYQECTTVGDTATDGCCYYVSEGKFVMPTGTKAVGEACGAASECTCGLQCLELEGTMNCLTICTDTCDEGDCTDTGFGFKVCVVTVEA